MKELFKRLVHSSFEEPTINLHVKVIKINLPEMEIYGHYEENFCNEKKGITISEQWKIEGQVNESDYLDKFDENDVDKLNNIKALFHIERNDADNIYHNKGLLGTGTLGINGYKQSVLTFKLEMTSAIYKSMKEHMFFIKENIDIDNDDLMIRVDLVNIRDGEQDYRVNFDVARMYF